MSPDIYALALGNTAVIKSSEDSPLTGGLMIADLFAEAGFGAFLHQGQICMSADKIIVARPLHVPSCRSSSPRSSISWKVGIEGFPIVAGRLAAPALSNGLTTIGLLAMILDTSPGIGDQPHRFLTGVVSAVWAAFSFGIVVNLWRMHRRESRLVYLASAHRGGTAIVDAAHAAAIPP